MKVLTLANYTLKGMRYASRDDHPSMEGSRISVKPQ